MTSSHNEHPENSQPVVWAHNSISRGPIITTGLAHIDLAIAPDKSVASLWRFAGLKHIFDNLKLPD